MPRDGKKPYSRRLNICAEDLCDPYEDAGASGASAEADAPRSRSHAVRLMDELDGEAAPRKSHATIPRVETPAQRSAPAAHPPSTATAQAPDADACAVLSVKPAREGDVVAVVLLEPGVEQGVPAERLRLYLLPEQYADLRPREGSIPRTEADALLEAGRLCGAIRQGMRLLQYGDHSARRLAYKLTVRGTDRETAEAAVAYLVGKGYIHENDTARLRAEQGARKLWGPRRIREDLRANGFTSDAVDEAMEAVADADFEENCAQLIRKKYRSVPADRAERQKMIAALLRWGYGMDVIHAACRLIERQK